MMLTRAFAVKCGLIFGGCALAASFVVDRDAEPPARSAEPSTRAKAAGAARAAKGGTGTASRAPLDLTLLNRAPAPEVEEDLFALPRPPAPAPPPRTRAVAAPPPPVPTAPPLPFKYLGTMIDGGTTTLFVSEGGQNFSLKPGEAVNDTYRLESLNESQAVFVYVPLGERQVLAIGSRD